MDNNVFDNRYICGDSEYVNARLALKSIEMHVCAGEKILGIDAFRVVNGKIIPYLGKSTDYSKEPLIYSVIHADGIFLCPAAS